MWEEPDALPRPELDRRDFRSALGCFPTGVCLVTTMGPGGKPEDAPPTMQYFIKITEILRNMKKENLTDRSILLGRPEQIIESLKKVEKAGIEEVILYFNVGNKPHALVKEQMQRFMEEIAPHFQGKHLERMNVGRAGRAAAA